jgi:ribosomal protein S12 methylthiotransferase accessory factor
MYFIVAEEGVSAMKLVLKSSPKIYGEGLHRVITPRETLRRVKPLMAKVGVTRLADITGLDYLGIPTYSSVVPRSHDLLSVYNGKGTTKELAKVGALMEAIERHAATTLSGPFLYGSYNELSRKENVLDPAKTGLRLRKSYTNDSKLAWIKGFDLCSQQEILVPVELAGYNLLGQYGEPCYASSTTNGLASGNTIEEAICHALCELIERDAWTIAEILSHWLPYARQKAKMQEMGEQRALNSADIDDDVSLYPNIDVSQANGTLRSLFSKFQKAGLEVMVKDITSDLQVPTVFATVVDSSGANISRSHTGLGTHPDVHVAITRALTEVAQSRVVDIQGVREDIVFSAEKAIGASHTKRVSTLNRRSWYHKASPQTRLLSELPRYVHSDILDDIHFMLTRLQQANLTQTIVVDLTHPEVGIPVVRVIVPGLEVWIVDHTPIGQRVLQHWKASVQKQIAHEEVIA